MQEYVPKEIEAKWQKYWEEHNLLDFDFDSENPKFYMLTILPYPSGDLHIGHWYANRFVFQELGILQGGCLTVNN